MKTVFIILLLFISLDLFSQTEQQVNPPFIYKRDFKTILEKTKDKNDSLYYGTLIKRFLENDPSLTKAETLALLIGFTENKYYKPVKDMETEKDIIELNDNGYYEDALDETKKYLSTNPLSLSALKERSFAYHQLKNRDSAEFFMDLNDKVMQAMIYSGKGKKQETAIFSLGLVDGDYFLTNAGMTPSNQITYIDKNKYLLYIADALTDDNAHVNFYFNIQHAKEKMESDEIAEKQSNKKLIQAKKKKSEKLKGKKKNGNSKDAGTETPTESDTETEKPSDPEVILNATDSLNIKSDNTNNRVDSTNNNKRTN